MAGRAAVERVEKPWGFEVWFAVNDRYAGKIIHIDPGEQLSLQYHERKDETVFVLSGELELELDDGHGGLAVQRLEPGESQRILPRLKHRMTATSGPVELCEVSTPELDDVVRLQDRYGRAGTSDR
ncbi:MAG TPA: cupin domain-containing protein [Candidatus Nanopelagicaceae bacterium]|nr:cupin domain-containing protein [Candidatus Nanopelagicaceae bacterium]